MDVSVIIPFFNGKEYLEETLKSVIAQKTQGLQMEIILIDDGSTDGAQELAGQYSGKYSWIICLKQEHLGVSAARNLGVSHASGEYICFCDADDLLPPGAVKRLYNTAKERNLDLVIGQIEEFHPYAVNIYQATKRLSEKTIIQRFDEDCLWNYMILGKLFRRELIIRQNIRFLPLAYSEDGVFSMQALFAAKRIGGAEGTAYRYRKRTFLEQKSVTQRCEISLWEDFYHAHQIIRELAEQELAGSALSDCEKERYRERVSLKFLESILNAFYRKIWLLQGQTEQCVVAAIEEQKAELSQQEWRQLLLKNMDLYLEEETAVKEDYIKKPLVAVLIDAGMGASVTEQILRSVYAQNFPAAAVVLYHCSNKPESFKNMENIYISEKDRQGLLEQLLHQNSYRPPFVMIIDSPIAFHTTTLSRLYREMKEKHLDVLFCKTVEEGERRLLKRLSDRCQETVWKGTFGRERVFQSCRHHGYRGTLFCTDWLAGSMNGADKARCGVHHVAFMIKLPKG